MIFLYCLVSISIIAQKIDLDTLALDQLNLYKQKAIKIRNTGMILTLSGFSLLIVSDVAGIAIVTSTTSPKNSQVLICFIGQFVGLASTVVGIPAWAIGGSRKKKVEITLQKFNMPRENSKALGLGITLRF